MKTLRNTFLLVILFFISIAVFSAFKTLSKNDEIYKAKNAVVNIPVSSTPTAFEENVNRQRNVYQKMIKFNV